MENIIPIWKKAVLNVEEASQYSHIGENKLRRMMNESEPGGWFFMNGTHFYIKRKEFLEFISRLESI